MNKIWEFALTPKRLAIVAACVGVSGIVLAAAGFAAGVILAPRVRSDLSVIGRNVSSEAAPTNRAKPAAETARTAPASASAGQPAIPQAAKEGSVPATGATGGTSAAAPTAAKAGAEAGNGSGKELPIQLAVRVASFASDDKARSTVAQLRDSGYPATDVSSKDASSQERHVVEVGPYAQHEDASRTVLELSTKYGFNPVIVASRVR